MASTRCRAATLPVITPRRPIFPGRLMATVSPIPKIGAAPVPSSCTSIATASAPRPATVSVATRVGRVLVASGIISASVAVPTSSAIVLSPGTPNVANVAMYRTARGESGVATSVARMLSISACVAVIIVGESGCVRPSAFTLTTFARSSFCNSDAGSVHAAAMRRATRASSIRRSVMRPVRIPAAHGDESQEIQTDTGRSRGVGGAPFFASAIVSSNTSDAVTTPTCARRPRSMSITSESITQSERHSAGSNA